ncbi:MAG TPA: ROK family protein [Mycobacteriales bacterium]|nr:ROK family protein [Mycobacteriales bacterium]
MATSSSSPAAAPATRPVTLGTPRVTPGSLLRLIRTGAARSRADLVALTGAPRSTVSARVEQLLAAKLVYEGGTGDSRGGRPPTLLAFNSKSGLVLAVDLGATSAKVALTDLAGEFLGSLSREIEISDGPEPVLAVVNAMADELLKDVGGGATVKAVGVGVPGPVEFATGRLVHPPLMSGWHDYQVPQAFARFACPVYVDNDVNVIAAGELGTGGSDENFLVVKIGTGIGCGIVVHGQVYRGTQGCAGDIGHIYVPSEHTTICRCGNENCLEAVAGGGAIAREAKARGLDVHGVKDLVRLALQGEPPALELVRNAGREIGGVLASLVNIFNPSRIVLVGSVAEAGNPLLAGIREVVYRRSLPLAARSLEITISDHGKIDGQLGAARLAIESLLDDDRVDAELEAV